MATSYGRTCAHCGTQAVETATFCASCGSYLNPQDSKNGSGSAPLPPTKCVGCGNLHFNEGLKCAACIEKDNWKPEHWEAYRTNSVFGSLKDISSTPDVVGKLQPYKRQLLMGVGIVMALLAVAWPAESVVRSVAKANKIASLTNSGVEEYLGENYQGSLDKLNSALALGCPAGPVSKFGTRSYVTSYMAMDYEKVGGQQLASGDQASAMATWQLGLQYDASNPDIAVDISKLQQIQAQEAQASQESQLQQRVAQEQQQQDADQLAAQAQLQQSYIGQEAPSPYQSYQQDTTPCINSPNPKPPQEPTCAEVPGGDDACHARWDSYRIAYSNYQIAQQLHDRGCR